jgi:hypothetical protein
VAGSHQDGAAARQGVRRPGFVLGYPNHFKPAQGLQVQPRGVHQQAAVWQRGAGGLKVQTPADRDGHHPVAVAPHDPLQGLQPRGAGPGGKADDQGPADADHVPALDGCRRRNAVQLSILSALKKGRDRVNPFITWRPIFMITDIYYVSILKLTTYGFFTCVFEKMHQFWELFLIFCIKSDAILKLTCFMDDAIMPGERRRCHDYGYGCFCAVLSGNQKADPRHGGPGPRKKEQGITSHCAANPFWGLRFGKFQECHGDC